MASVVYKRLCARVERLVPGEWTDLTAHGGPALCCAKCGSIYDLPTDTHRVDSTGFVVPAVKCADPLCTEFGYIRLEDWSQTVVP